LAIQWQEAHIPRSTLEHGTREFHFRQSQLELELHRTLTSFWPKADKPHGSGGAKPPSKSHQLTADQVQKLEEIEASQLKTFEQALLLDLLPRD
jgi:hypothetical protein